MKYETGTYMYLVFDSYKSEFANVMANNEFEAWTKAIERFGELDVSAIQLPLF